MLYFDDPTLATCFLALKNTGSFSTRFLLKTLYEMTDAEIAENEAGLIIENVETNAAVMQVHINNRVAELTGPEEAEERWVVGE